MLTNIKTGNLKLQLYFAWVVYVKLTQIIETNLEHSVPREHRFIVNQIKVPELYLIIGFAKVHNKTI